jgi:hypothetical protein
MSLEPKNAVRKVWREKTYQTVKFPLGVNIRKCYFVFLCVECQTEIEVPNTRKELVKHQGRCKHCSSSQLIRSGECATFIDRVSKTRLRPYESLFNALKRTAEVNAKARAAAAKRDFSLTYEQFLAFTKIKECHYCASELPWQPYGKCGSSRTYNLDRKDNAMGYVAENLVACCGRCNYIKSNVLSYEEMLLLGPGLRQIAARRNFPALD